MIKTKMLRSKHKYRSPPGINAAFHLAVNIDRRLDGTPNAACHNIVLRVKYSLTVTGQFE